MKRKLIYGLLVLALIAAPLFAVSCAEEEEEEEVTPPAQQEEEEEEEVEVFELTFANPAPATTRTNSVLNVAWINWIEQESGGRIKITQLCGGEGAAAEDLYDAARTGIVDIAQCFFSLMPGAFPLHDIGTLPLLFETPDARTGVLTMMALHDKYPEFGEYFTDVQFLSYFHVGASQIHTKDTPIHTLEDMQGLLLAEHGAASSQIAELLGASPVFLDMSEVTDSLVKGICEAIETNYMAHLIIYGTIDICNYTVESGIMGGDAVNVMNLDTWNSLPPDLQALFVGENAWNFVNAIGYDWDLDNIANRDVVDQTLKDRGYEGVYILPEAERARWFEAVQPMYELWVEAVTPVVGEETARAMLDDAISFAQEYKLTDAARDEAEAILRMWGVEGY